MHLVLLIVALILVALSAFSVPAGKVSLAWLGMAFFIASFIEWGSWPR